MRYGDLAASGVPERQHSIVVMLFLFILFLGQITGSVHIPVGENCSRLTPS